MTPEGIGTAIAAIWASGAKGTDALVLVCLAHSLDWRTMDGSTGIPSLEIAGRIGMARSVVVESLGRLEFAGVVEVAPFVNGLPKSRRIRWDVLASYSSPETKRGGVRTPDGSEHRTGTSPNTGQEVSEHRTGTQPNTGQDPSEDRTLIVPPPPEGLPESSVDARPPAKGGTNKTRVKSGRAAGRVDLPADLAEVWSVYREEQAAIGCVRGKAPPKGWGVKARIDDPAIGVDGMVAIIRWAHRSAHDRAKWLRDGGHLGETLFRESKAPEYLPLALAWRDGTERIKGARQGWSHGHDATPPSKVFPPTSVRWRSVLTRLRLDGDEDLVDAWLKDSELVDERTVGVRNAYCVDWLTTGGGLDDGTIDMVNAIAVALDVPRHRLRFVERTDAIGATDNVVPLRAQA